MGVRVWVQWDLGLFPLTQFTCSQCLLAPLFISTREDLVSLSLLTHAWINRDTVPSHHLLTVHSSLWWLLLKFQTLCHISIVNTIFDWDFAWVSLLNDWHLFSVKRHLFSVLQSMYISTSLSINTRLEWNWKYRHFAHRNVWNYFSRAVQGRGSLQPP